MKNQITFLILFIVLGFCSLQAQVTQEWVARYNGPGNGIDEVTSLAVDGSGNVHVTGRSYSKGTGSEYVTIKYNSSGDSLWVARYNGTGNFDYATSLAVDGSGNVYVTGNSVGIGTGNNSLTIKYNSSGDSLWVARSNGAGNNFLTLLSLAVDGSGNVYVTGYIDGGNKLIKYNSSGVQQWVQRYNGGGASSLAVDGSGNVYVAGRSYGDYVTIKYNSSGDSLWVARYNGPGNGSDEASSLAVDDSENVYVTGVSGVTGNFDYATIKYNPSGVQQWVQRDSGKGGNLKSDLSPSLAVGSSGNVYVTGGSNGDYTTIKYNLSGVQQWVQRYNGPGNSFDYALSIAVDGSENVYVTGVSGIGMNNDYATIKYNSSGIQAWVQRYNGPVNGFDYAHSLAVDGSGNVYVTGISTGSGTSLDYATIKYSQLTGISQTNNTIPEKFSLSQNYPNPFNPITVIRYSLIENRFLTLKVYDILGNEVATLVNEKQNAGSYSVDFDGSNFPSGIYFYKLQTDNFSETKKMTIIK